MFLKVAYFFSRSCSLEIVNYLVIQLGQLIDIVMGNIFGKYIEWFCGMEAKFRLFLVWERTAANQKQTWTSLRVFSPFKVCAETIKYSKHQLIINRSPLYCHLCPIAITLIELYCHFIKIIKVTRNSPQSSQQS